MLHSLFLLKVNFFTYYFPERSYNDEMLLQANLWVEEEDAVVAGDVDVGVNFVF